MAISIPLPWLNPLSTGDRTGESLPSTTLAPSVSLLERYQGAFGGAALALESISVDPSQFSWETLRVIAQAYDRPVYRYHQARSPQRAANRSWSGTQWLLAEMLWQSLDAPHLLGDGTQWLRQVMAGWRSLPNGALFPENFRDEMLTTGETAIALLEMRTPLPQWHRWFREQRDSQDSQDNFWEDIPPCDQADSPLTPFELWVILGILSRTDGHGPIAIAQLQSLSSLTDRQTTTIYGWIGATIGLVSGQISGQISGQSPSPFASPPFPSHSNWTLAARHQGTQCFLEWAGLPPAPPSSLTPWTVACPT